MRMRNMTVGDLMTTTLLTLKERDTVDQADIDMHLAEVRHIPIVDDRRHVVGIISDRDLLRAFGSARVEGPIEVGRIMTRRVRTVTISTPAYRAAQLMIAHKIGALPVVGEDEQLVGIITETDFLRVAFEALGGPKAG
jgi:CBS domain-containing protein